MFPEANEEEPISQNVHATPTSREGCKIQNKYLFLCTCLRLLPFYIYAVSTDTQNTVLGTWNINYIKLQLNIKLPNAYSPGSKIDKT